jgi:hypothetical protein
MKLARYEKPQYYWRRFRESFDAGIFFAAELALQILAQNNGELSILELSLEGGEQPINSKSGFVTRELSFLTKLT